MQLAIDEASMEQIIDTVLQKRGYVPEEQVIGRTIGIDEFAKKYAKPHGPAWVKRNILYPFQPDWCSNIHPNGCRVFKNCHFATSTRMNEHRKEIDWDAK